MNAKHTPGPLKVVMRSTCCAAWPGIVQVCTDPETGEIWERELGDTKTSHLETPESRASEEFPETFDEAPHRFRLDTDGEESIANATLWATSPELLSELQAAHQIIRNALSVMTPTQKLAWAVKNVADDVSGEGDTRANEREKVIKKALGEQQ